MKKKIIIVLGTTAVGKTEYAIKKAKEYNTEIISFDSRQFYKEMEIGTAIPNKKELSEVKHHFIQNKSISEKYTIGDFEKEATQKVHEILKNKNEIIMTGGSFMYLNTVLYGLDEFPDVPIEIREKLSYDYKKNGISYLQDLLKKIDIEYYNKVDINNHQRLIRALEICISTGKPFSSFLSNKKNFKLPYKIEFLFLNRNRENIYDRINKRVDIMMEMGLLEEVKSLYQYKNYNALQTVGYKELFSFLDGNITLEKAIEKIKINTRRYAKRQLTWIKNKYDNSLINIELDN